jgi:hypothetical protein
MHKQTPHKIDVEDSISSVKHTALPEEGVPLLGGLPPHEAVGVEGGGGLHSFGRGRVVNKTQRTVLQLLLSLAHHLWLIPSIFLGRKAIVGTPPRLPLLLTRYL